MVAKYLPFNKLTGIHTIHRLYFKIRVCCIGISRPVIATCNSLVFAVLPLNVDRLTVDRLTVDRLTVDRLTVDRLTVDWLTV